MGKKGLAFLTAVFLAMVCRTAALAGADPEELRLTEEGFLPLAGQEYIHISEQEGQWIYINSGISIRVTRYRDDTPLEWFEADIHASPDEPLRALVQKGKSGKHRLVNPLAMAEESKAVLAITDDFCGYRLQKGHTPGILVRNGVVEGEKTRKSTLSRAWPNLDVLALYGDGRMESYVSDAHTAEEFVAMGAVDVFAFGPVLVQEGRINPALLEEDYYPYKEPRIAIGMAEPYHYVILAVTGRSQESKGARLTWLANRFVDLGVTEALNLDGGNTGAMIFLGEVLNRSPKNMRSVSTMIGFGRAGLAAQP